MRLRLRMLALCAVVASSLGGVTDARQEPDSVLIREIYVPYEHFERLTKESRDGVVMELAEYRDLVRAAIDNIEKQRPVELPPIVSAIPEAIYHGKLLGETARFDAHLTVNVTSDDWVRCPLGSLPASISTVRVGGEPGWLVVDRKGKSAQSVLLLRGKGTHQVRIVFSVPAVEKNERVVVASPIPAAATALLELEVPGRAEGAAKPGFLETVEDGRNTVFRVALGSSRSFELSWQRRKTIGENPAVLRAKHHISYSPRPQSAFFVSDSTVIVARQPVTELTFVEPPSATVVAVESELLHSWERTDEGIKALLKAPHLGAVQLRLSGIFELTGDRFTLGPPILAGAQANTGKLALLTPGHLELTVESVTATREIAPDEAQMPTLANPSGSAVARLYSFTTTDARIVGRAIDPTLRLETRSSYLGRILEGSVSLHGFLFVQARRGRTHELIMTLPAGLSLVNLVEAPGGTGRGVEYEEFGTDDQRRVRILLERAIDANFPLEMLVSFEHTQFPPDRDWSERTLEFTLPTFVGAAASRTDLGLAVHDSVYIDAANFDGWRSLMPEETRRIGLDVKGEESARLSFARLVAGVTTESSNPSVSLELAHRAARGEYRAVTHLLAGERAYGTSAEEHTLRVRCDIQVAVVDRGLEELTVRLPQLADGVNVIILGDGIKEITGDNASRSRTVQFLTPWIGTRQLRVEYEAPIRPGSPTLIPELELVGDFGSERFVVLQSQGSVEVESSAGDGLAVVDSDDIPDFAEPWSSGRILKAYRFRGAGTAGTLATTLHARAPVLSHLAQKLSLTTVIGADGTSVTRAEFLLAYSKAQSLRVRLPERSRCLSVALDGDPIRALRVEEIDGRRVYAIPLPPRSYVNCSLVYENPDRTRWDWSPNLGAFGTWNEEGPVFIDTPTSETTWEIFHPHRYRFFVSGGNLRAVNPKDDRRVETFAGSFFGRILSGRLPIFTVLRRNVPRREIAVMSPLTEGEKQGARSTGSQSGASRIAPQGQRRPQGDTAGAPLAQVYPEGRRIVLSKFGGQPDVAISYRTFGWWRFAKQSVFLITVVGCLVLGLSRGRRQVWRLILWGLFFGTLVPVAFHWESPFLMIPFCEGLVATSVGIGLLKVLALLGGIVARRFGRSAALAPATLLMGCAILFAAPPVHGDEEITIADLFDSVLIPYSPTSPPWLSPDGIGKAFVTQKRFQELWKLAHPDEEDEPKKKKTLPYELIIGNANYDAVMRDDKYRLYGSIKLYVHTDEWVTLKLPFDRAQMLRLLLDEELVGVSQHDGAPAIEIKGRGEHSIDVELAGSVHQDLGEFHFRTKLLRGAATSVISALPEGSVVKLPKSSPGTTSETMPNGTTRVATDLGSAQELVITWSFPQVEGQLASQRESASLATLTLTEAGFWVHRRERLRITGRPVERASYRVLGDWQITDVRGNDLAEWNVSDENGETRLELFFAQPLNAFAGVIEGNAVMAESGPLCTLELLDQVRQESFVGLVHGARRRFNPDVLGGMDRASRRELAGFEAQGDFDRIYKTFGSGAGERLAVTPVASTASVASHAVALLRSDRLLIFVHSRYGDSQWGPVRHRVTIPDGWEVRTVRCDTLRSWEVSGTGGARELRVELGGRARPGTEITWSAELPLAALPETLTLPGLTLRHDETDARLDHDITWTLAAAEELELESRGAAGWEPIALDGAPRWVALPSHTSYRFAFRSRRGASGLQVATTLRRSVLTATSVAFVQSAEAYLRVNTRIRYRVQFAGRDRFFVTLPRGAQLVYADMKNQRSQTTRETADGVELEIQLQSPAQGDHYLDLVYRIPRVAGSPAVVEPTRVHDESGRITTTQYVGVVQAGRAFVLEATPDDNLEVVETESLPFVPEGISDRSLRPTYRAKNPVWRLTLNEQEMQLTDRFDAIVKLVDISTRLGIDGTLRTEVTFSLVNESLQFLEVELPPEANLWGVTVNGRPVSVGRSGEDGNIAARRVQIPVERAGADVAVEVALVYEEPSLSLPAFRERASLIAPRIPNPKVKVGESIWSVQFPDDYDVSERGKRMRQAPPSMKYAKKLEHLMEQKQSLVDASKSSESRRAQQRATRSLARVEQALGDNLAELRGTHDSAMERSQTAQIGERFLREQQAGNVVIMRQAEVAQLELRDQLERDKQRGGQQGLSRDEEAFNDRTNFLKGRSWRGGKKVRDADAASEARRGGTGPTPEGLLEHHAYKGYSTLAVDAGAAGVEISQPKPISGEGLRPLPDSARLGATPGLKLTEADDGTVTYTFSRSDGNAELSLVVSQRGSFPRLGAWLVLLAVVGFLIWRRQLEGRTFREDWTSLRRALGV